METIIEMIMQSAVGTILRHIGAVIRYLFLRIICRRKDVSYKNLRYDDKKASALANFDNNFANGCLGMIVIAILIVLMVKYF